jgi:hypothetical protein
MRLWAEDLGHSGPPFAWDETRRAELQAELDAFIARKYGLSREELHYVLDPADAKGAGYPSETFRVLKTKEEARFGEYRTQRLVLEAWDRLAGTQIGAAAPTVVTLPTPMRPPQPQPDMRAVRDGDWARPMTNARGETMEVFLAILKAMDRPMPAERVRLAALLAMEPNLLTPHLEADQATHWSRVIGGEVAGPAPDSAELDGHWGATLRHFRSRGWLEETAGNWSPGVWPDDLPAGDWAAGRAAIAWDAMRLIGDKAEVISLFSTQLDRWRNAEAA